MGPVAQSPPQMKTGASAAAGVSQSCSRNAWLAAAAKNATQKGVGGEQNKMNRANAELRRKYFRKPQSLDVCCGRGKGAFGKTGNLIFQEVIRKHLDAYEKADSKTLKSAIISAVVNSLHVNHNLRFIKQDPDVGKWYVLSFSESHEKTGQAIRDQLTRIRRKQSSLRAKALLSPISIPWASSVSSTETKKIVAPMAHRQDMLVKKDEPDLPCFHLVSPEEEDDPWSDQISYTDTVDPTSSLWGDFLGTDVSVLSRSSGDHDLTQRDNSLAHALLDQHVELPPQGTLPKGPPSTPRHLRHHTESVGDMLRRSGVMP